MKFNVSKNVWLLHMTVLVWGFTGILGALIEVSAIYLVWYRVLIAAISLFLYFKISGKNLRIPWKTAGIYALTGGLVGLHWLLFFHSIKVSNVSVTLVCLSSVTLFTSILEPLIKRKKISLAEVITGCLIIMGIYLIFTFESDYTLGIIFGLSCALMASLFSIINSQLMKTGHAGTISLYEMSGAFLWISIFMLVTGNMDQRLALNSSDLIYLLLLGTICTAAAYVAGVAVMKELSAFTVALVTNLEPVYGIILAWIFFGQEEKMSGGFYLGAVIVLGAVFLFPYFKKLIEKQALKSTLNRNKS